MKDGTKISLYVSAMMYSMYLTHYTHADITLADTIYMRLDVIIILIVTE
jgi:hypothetical protein